ncbi:MAG: transcriptional repressor [Lachnospiraceae bacterium]|nr:transcriptional repressor [Lachnospiraceae bacterium]
MVNDVAKRKTKSASDSCAEVIRLLRSSGYRITRQRRLIVEVIMRNDYTTCKDIYYQVLKEDKTIGLATVYRKIRRLEDLKVVNRIERIEVCTNIK